VVGIRGSVRALDLEGAPLHQLQHLFTNCTAQVKTTMGEQTMKTQLPLTLQLAEPRLIAGEVDIQLSSRTNTKQQSASFNGHTGVQVDVSADVQVDDVIA
jgi:hypothetical protein